MYKTAMGIAECFSKNLREYRRRRNFTQEGLAQRAELSLAAIQLLETGRRWPEKETIVSISKALGIRENDLFSEVDWTGQSKKDFVDAYNKDRAKRDMKEIVRSVLQELLPTELEKALKKLGR